MSAEVQQLHGGGAPLREVMLGAESGLQPGSSFWTWARCLSPNKNLRPQPTRPQLLRAALEGEWERGDAHAIAGHHSTRHYWGSQGAERSVLSPPPPTVPPSAVPCVWRQHAALPQAGWAVEQSLAAAAILLVRAGRTGGSVAFFLSCKWRRRPPSSGSFFLSFSFFSLSLFCF